MVGLVIALAWSLLGVAPSAATTRHDGPLSPTTGAYLGLYPRAGDAWDEASIQADYTDRATLMGRDAAVVNWYRSFAFDWPNHVERWHRDNGRIPMVSWAGTTTSQIAAGTHDATIDERASAVRAFGTPIFLRFFWEPEAAFNAGIVGTPADYVAAWRRVVERFRAAGAGNAVFVWCPTAFGFTEGTAAPYYPGDDVVDWICADGYEWSPVLYADPKTPQDVFDDFYAWGTARGKPLMVGEFATIEDTGAGADPDKKADWIDAVRVAASTDYPNIQAWIWFDSERDEPAGTFDWRVDTSPQAASAFATLAQDPWFDTSPATDPPLFPPCPTGPHQTLASVTPEGGFATGSSDRPSVDADGSHVAFHSAAADLVADDTNGRIDVFVRAMDTANDGVFLRSADTGTATVNAFRNVFDTTATALVSVGWDGSPANGDSRLPSISDDGTRVAFWSTATNLVPDDTNGYPDVFVRDLVAGTTTRVSVDSAGIQGDRGSYDPSISGDGRWVAFHSWARNLAGVDTSDRADVFLHDLLTGTTTRLSERPDGAMADGPSFRPSVNDDGSRVAFGSEATDLVTDDTNGRRDIFVWDATSGVSLVSTAHGGGPSNGFSMFAELSGDGSAVAYRSWARNLVTRDSNNNADIFHTTIDSVGSTVLVSVQDDGSQAAGRSDELSISDDGRRVAFASNAWDLATDDKNGSLDVFVRDLDAGTTTHVSTSHKGRVPNGRSAEPSLSDDGLVVAFTTGATNVCSADDNGAHDVLRRTVTPPLADL